MEPMRQVLDLHETDEASGESILIGRTALSADGQLSLLAALPHRKAFLAGVVRDLNKKKTFQVRIPPSPSSPKFAIATRSVRRGDDDFAEAVAGYLKRYHGIELDV